MDSNLFRRACAQFATGVAIASALDQHGLPHGMTINSFTSVSMDPPLVLICVDKTSNLLSIFEHCGHYGLSFLGHHQQALSHRFAQRGQDRFDGTPWMPGAHGVPLIPDALAHLECRITSTVTAGDHTVLIAEVISADIQSGRPLLYFESGYRRLE
jgi:flavin reductase (DIM6/NTAB) family NADH-FMN oxidoreductase RutF